MPRKDLEQRKKYNKEYTSRPEVRARRRKRDQRPEYKKKIQAWNRAWYLANREHHRAYQKANWEAIRHRQRLKKGTTVKPDNCECCGRKKRLQWDHDHDTGFFRGWICTSCNAGIGQLGDTIEGVQCALQYLKRSVQ